jgi:colicin import membrane protein
MKYVWTIVFCASLLLLGCQSEKEQEVPPHPNVENGAAKAVANVDEDSEEGDIANGEKQAYRCKGCHSLEPDDEQMTGPNLFGIFGKTAGKVAGFNQYSDGLKNADVVWDEVWLSAWICNSYDTLIAMTDDEKARTRMSIQGKCGTNGQDIVAYIKSLK